MSELLPKDMRGFRYRVRYRIGEVEVEAEIGRAAMRESFDLVRAMLQNDIQTLVRMEKGMLDQLPVTT